MHSYVISLCIVHLVYFTQFSLSIDATAKDLGAKAAKTDKLSADSEKRKTEVSNKVSADSKKVEVEAKALDKPSADSEKWKDEVLEKTNASGKVKAKAMVNPVEESKAESLDTDDSDATEESSSEDKKSSEKEKEQAKNRQGPEWQYFGAEQLTGEKSDLSHSNPKYKLTQHYDLDQLGRRHDIQDLEDLDILAEEHLLRSVSNQDGDTLTPVKANPEFVLAVVNATKQITNSSFTHLVPKEALRTSDFFDGAWLENINPAMLRTGEEPETPITLEAVKVKVYEGTRLHEIVNELRKISPQLLYVINKQ